MPYTLLHTAEAIDYKLNLINKNKNLLPYPYNTDFLVELENVLENVGDGSILTTDVSTRESRKEILLNTCNLSAGKKYIISLDITNITDEAITNSADFSLKVSIAGKDPVSTDSFEVLDLSAETEEASAAVYLIAPTAFVAGLLIKPQIEEVQVLENGQEQVSPTKWVPYMKTIGEYVDERFNSINAKIKLLNKQLEDLAKLVDIIEIIEE